MPFHNSAAAVVAGVQDRDSGRHVLAQAMDLAAKLEAELVVAHVEEVPIAAGVGLPASGMAGPPAVPLPAEEAAQLDQARAVEEIWVQELCAQVAAEFGLEDVRWTHRRGQGDPGRVLAELAAEVDAYCVVVGSRGEGILATVGRMFRPSVPRSVLRERRVPVLVVPATDDDDDDVAA